MCDRSRAAIASADLDSLAAGQDMHFSLRYALAHMIEETARHCGQLDLLREHIDGTQAEWFIAAAGRRHSAAGVSWMFNIHDPFCPASIAENPISVIPPRFARYAFEIGCALLA
jgi:hypothetical protein